MSFKFGEAQRVQLLLLLNDAARASHWLRQIEKAVTTYEKNETRSKHRDLTERDFHDLRVMQRLSRSLFDSIDGFPGGKRWVFRRGSKKREYERLLQKATAIREHLQTCIKQLGHAKRGPQHLVFFRPFVREVSRVWEAKTGRPLSNSKRVNGFLLASEFITAVLDCTGDRIEKGNVFNAIREVIKDRNKGRGTRKNS